MLAVIILAVLVAGFYGLLKALEWADRTGGRR